MAYLPQSAIVMPARGGISAQSYGISGRFNSIEGLSGFGQACDTTPLGSMTPDQMVNCGYTDPVTGALTNLPGMNSTSTVAGIPNNVLLIGAAIVGGIILLGAFKR